jgi:deoxycytidylate deaminase
MRLIRKGFAGLIEQMRKVAMDTPNPFKHVATIMRGSSIIAMGDNCLQTCCSKTCHGKSTKCSLHAEANAIRKAASNRSIKNTTSVDLIVIRVSPTGIIGQSKPCFQCMQQISKARFRISKVYYSNAKGEIICENINQLLRTSVIHIGFGIREKLNMFSGDIPIETLLQNKTLAQILITKY